MTEDEMVGWHHRLNGHVFEKAMGDVEGEAPILWPPDNKELTHWKRS